MPGRDTAYELLARDAADRLERDREMQVQLSLLPDERDGAALVEGDRPVRGKGKALSQLREWLAAKGYRLPEDVLAEIAGLTSGQDAVATAMAQAERIPAWAEGGAEAAKGHPVRQTLSLRLATFQQVYTAQLRAADAMLPYGAPKASPDVTVNQTVQVVTAPAAPSGDRPAALRDVTPDPARRMLPADVMWKNEQKQQVADADPQASDTASRTE